MEKKNKYFYNDGKNIFINKPYAEAYIPTDILVKNTDDPTASSIAYLTGDSVVTIGLFYMRFFDDPNAPRDQGELKTFKFPNIIETFPYESTQVAELEFNGRSDQYLILKYEYGDKMMDANTHKTAANSERFTRLIMSGKIPKSVGYDEGYFAWKKNFELEGVNAAVPPIALQAMYSEMCRNPDDLSQQFRFVIGKDKKVTQYMYEMLNMNEVSAYTSVVSALSFERFAEKLSTSLLMVKSGTKQKETPLDEIIRF